MDHCRTAEGSLETSRRLKSVSTHELFGGVAEDGTSDIVLYSTYAWCSRYLAGTARSCIQHEVPTRALKALAVVSREGPF